MNKTTTESISADLLVLLLSGKTKKYDDIYFITETIVALLDSVDSTTELSGKVSKEMGYFD